MRIIILFLVVLTLVPFRVTAGEKKKLNPELSDPVLGDRLAVTEWAWSPQYAKRFGLTEQENGLNNGPLWLIGIKIEREQFKYHQSYICRIKGLIDNKTVIQTPPGDMYVKHPYNYSIGEFPGKPQGVDSHFVVTEQGITPFTPLQVTWRKNSGKKSKRPASNITIDYRVFHRYYLPDLAYFELDAACPIFKDPEQFRNEIRFPMGQKKTTSTDIFDRYPVSLDIPNNLMKLVFPYIEKARTWNENMKR